MKIRLVGDNVNAGDRVFEIGCAGSSAILRFRIGEQGGIYAYTSLHMTGPGMGHLLSRPQR